MAKRKKYFSMNDYGLVTIFCMDNFGVHVDTPDSEEAAASITYQIRKLLANAMYLIPPIDLFVISKINYMQRADWDKYNM